MYIFILFILFAFIPDFSRAEDIYGNITVPEGQDVTLQCTFFKYPAPAADWRREGGKRLPGGSQLVHFRALKLFNVQKEDAGTYSCVYDAAGSRQKTRLFVCIAYPGTDENMTTTSTTTTSTTTQAPTATTAAAAAPVTTTTDKPFSGSTTLEEKIFNCLKAKRWTNLAIQKWYSRVLNPETRTGRVTRYDQDLVRGCVDIDDYLYYGVTPDGYSSTTSSPSSSTSSQPGGVKSSPTINSSIPSLPPS